MTKKLEKAIKILEKRVRVLEARLVGYTPAYSNYHELREECAAMKRILEFVKANLS